jgi:hypothetical protein
MKLNVCIATTCVLAALSTGAHAQYATIEEAAAITDDNVTRYERDSIKQQGDMRRFDVTVAWRDGFVRPEGAPPRKTVRYLVKCAVKEIALASVATFGTGGETTKLYGIAPGGWDFAAPAAGSREAEWMTKACTESF